MHAISIHIEILRLYIPLKIIEQCSVVITDKGIFGPVTFFGYFSILLELSEPGNAPVQIHKTSIAK
jgi:hypothetical protein